MGTLLLAASWGDVIETYLEGDAYSWLTDLLNAISTVLWIALILVGAVGAVYAIFIGIKMARAESSDQREEAKKHLINVIVSIVVVIVLILFFNTLLPMILDGFGLFKNIAGD